MKAQQIFDQLVERLIHQIETGAGQWAMPWRQIPDLGIPTNATTRTAYRGTNILLLMFAQLDAGHTTAQWATYRQWQTLGAQVRKGETGTGCVRWVTNSDHDNSDPDDEKVRRRRMIPVGFTVFNRDQVDNPPPLDTVDHIEPPDTETWFDNIPARIEWGRPAACYIPAFDRVEMPAWDAFHTSDDAHATLAHELAHWTGHRSRLGRTFGTIKGDDAYALEELTAELSAAFTCAHLGLATVDRSNDHATYLASWCRVLRAQPNILWTVTSNAQAATDYLAAYTTTDDVDVDVA